MHDSFLTKLNSCRLQNPLMRLAKIAVILAQSLSVDAFSGRILLVYTLGGSLLPGATRGFR